MAEMTKKLHFLKNGIEQTAKAYSTTDEVGELHAFTKIDGIDCYVPLTTSTKDDYDIEEWVDATNGRVIKTQYVKKVMVDEPWQQPVLSANGTMGGSKFACAVSAYSLVTTGTVSDAYGAFDNNTNTYWRSGTTSGWIQFYNPVPLKVSAIKWGYFYSYPTGGNVQGSNDGTTWTTLNTWTNSSAADFTINLSTQQYYKYYRINITGVNTDVIHVHSLTITATYQKEVEKYVGQHDDYDYSTTETYAILSTGASPYAKKQWTTAGTYTFTVPARITRIRATCVGGGGAGTARHTNANTANGEDSSFGSVVAKGGNSCRLNGDTVVQYPYGGSPNGRSGGLWCRGGAFTATDAAGNEYQVNDTTKDVYHAGGKGFALSTSKADGDYGRGGQVYNWDYYCTYGSGGSGGWNQQTIAVTPNTTITVKVGARANYASGDADGINTSESNQARGGFVIIEYGQGV